MKILLVNKFYYRRGGDCIVTLNLERLLKAHGHEVAVFAMSYLENLPSEWSKYFPSEVKFKPGIGVIEALRRPFGTSEVKKKFTSLLDDFQPDVVHLNNIHTQLSPIIAEIAHKRGIKVVWTLHDTKLVCPSYGCERGGVRCVECFTNPKAVLKHRCVKGSAVASLLGYLEARKWNVRRLEACTDLFIAPSQFMKDTMVAGGYNPDKIQVLCNFIDLKKVQQTNATKDNFYCFLGRVTEIKGIRTLLQAASELPEYQLKVIGGGPLLDELKAQYKDFANIEMLGQKDWDEIRPILEKALFMVQASEVAENNPLTVIEAQSLGTPVLGARIGGIPELIEEGVSGMTFESKNVESLKEGIRKMMSAKFDYQAIAERARERYSDEKYHESLIEICNSLIISQQDNRACSKKNKRGLLRLPRSRGGSEGRADALQGGVAVTV